MPAQICGTQNDGLRGGTENIIGIAGAFEALKFTMENRKEKNERLFSYRKTLLVEIKNKFPLIAYVDYLKMRSKLFDANGDPLPLPQTHKLIVLLSPLNVGTCVPSTILLSIVRTDVNVCNVKIKNDLCAAGVIVSIGSACNTSNSKASHVLDAIGAPPEIKRGTLRISFGDINSREQIGKFIAIFVNIVNSSTKK
jgi:cysteine desulfurase